ncbi:MAG: hypothetical protein JSR82_00350 [Verrucomicrobia bacterium]|nr:hypothetical protein [Verrucomicrobiota bacterium]
MDLPISKDAAVAATEWLKSNFGDQLQNAANGTAFTANHLCGIVCQESAYRWLGWRKKASVAQILGACVLDGSGDVAGSSRTAFPRNTAEFRAEFGENFTRQLIQAGNRMRALMGWNRVDWLYKGYGIFQYDLQFVRTDRAYFEEAQWGDFSACLSRVMQELARDWKWVTARFPTEARAEQIRLTIKKYNGSGSRAEAYSNNVVFYAKIAATVS